VTDTQLAAQSTADWGQIEALMTVEAGSVDGNVTTSFTAAGSGVEFT
jgi:hypothetical protein